jgi:DNA-binding transcriptional regulator YdaS (Cro superfamily)
VSANIAGQADLIAILRSECIAAGGQQAWARGKGFSPQYVNDVLRGRRDVSEAMANALGFVREVRFRPLGIRRVA